MGGGAGGSARWSRTDLENCLPSDDYGVAIGNLMPWWFCREGCHKSEGELWKCCE